MEGRQFENHRKARRRRLNVKLVQGQVVLLRKLVFLKHFTVKADFQARFFLYEFFSQPVKSCPRKDVIVQLDLQKTPHMSAKVKCLNPRTSIKCWPQASLLCWGLRETGPSYSKNSELIEENDCIVQSYSWQKAGHCNVTESTWQ